MIPEEDKTTLTKMLEEKGIYFTPSIEIPLSRLNGISLIELETNNRDGAYNQVRLALKPVANYGWDSPILRVSNIYGDEFSIHVYLGRTKDVPTQWEITIWDYKGTTSIGTWAKPYKSNDDRLSNEEIRAIKERLEEFSHDVLHCSDCKTTMPATRQVKFNSNVHKQEYGGQYFAGHYCRDCWERKWKAIEAKENYE